MQWKAYDISPIDAHWDFLQTLEQVQASLRERDAKIDQFQEDVMLPCFLDAWLHAQRLASAAGWEGVVRGDVRVFWLPAENEFQYAFVWKQGNNGTTFVVSPFELPHLNQHM